MVLLSAQKHCLLQPCHRGAHAVVVGYRIPFESFVFILKQDFTGGGYHLAAQSLSPIQIPQCSQHSMDFPPRQPRISRHAKLVLHIFRRVKQHAARRPLVSAGAARLLQVILQ